MKKLLQLSLIAASLFVGTTSVKAADYNVEYNYKDASELTAEEKGNLQKLDKYTITKDTKVTFVYEKNGSCEIQETPKVEEPKQPETPSVEEPKQPETPSVEEPKQPETPKVEEPKQPEAPKVIQPNPNVKQTIDTRDGFSPLFASGVLLGSAVILFVAYKNRKSLKVMVVLALAVSGLVHVSSVNAFEGKEAKSFVVTEYTELDFTTEALDCYDIVGVIIEEKDIPVVPDTGSTGEDTSTNTAD